MGRRSCMTNRAWLLAWYQRMYNVQHSVFDEVMDDGSLGVQAPSTSTIAVSFNPWCSWWPSLLVQRKISGRKRCIESSTTRTPTYSYKTVYFVFVCCSLQVLEYYFESERAPKIIASLVHRRCQ